MEKTEDLLPAVLSAEDYNSCDELGEGDVRPFVEVPNRLPDRSCGILPHNLVLV